LTGLRGSSVSGAGRSSKTQASDKRVVVPFEDNRLMSRLLGEYDSHLALIEDRLGIGAHAHGNVIILTGNDNDCAIAREVLETLYKRISKGEHIGAGDFDGLIRHARQESQPSDGQAQIATRRRVVKARTLAQSTYIRALEKSDLVFGIGPAGTGKTYIAVAAAAQALERGVVERIILSRPAVEAGERLGFLPGDMRDKVDPYLRPLYDALYDLMGAEKVAKCFEKNLIEIAPLAYMRGRTLNHAFIILDEAQNTTPEQMKMFLTRIGLGSKAVVTGDITQIDLNHGQKSGLIEAAHVLKAVPGIAFTRLTKDDVVRHPLVARIVEAYEKETKSSKTK
jgi:phosphate starvation-inducible protein PhoH and related proteins